MIKKTTKIFLYNIIQVVKVSFFNYKKRTHLMSVNASLNAKYGKNVLIDNNTYVSDNVEIGDYSYVNKNSHIENCTIGKYCSISSGVYICPAEHDIKNYSTHPILNNNRQSTERVIIGNDVLISLNAIILSDVKIGDGAVIAAGAVVTKDVKDYEVVGGVPAKHIKFRFENNKIKELKESQWWELSLTRIKETLDKQE